MNKILADGRWRGSNGIGRFSSEVLPRLSQLYVLREGPSPLSLYNLFWQSHFLRQHRQKFKAYFSPGFNPTLNSPIPVVFTIHDLIHLFSAGKYTFFKKVYYASIMKIAARQAYKILTVSDYSKQTLLEWANIPSTAVEVVGNGISECFTLTGKQHAPGYPYFLCVSNAKPHKNVLRLLQAFANAKIDRGIRLILTAKPTPEIMQALKQHSLIDRVIFAGLLNDVQLAAYYRGAIALLFPSLFEGFGLPVVEAMACGTAVLTSNVTSLPQIAGDAALLVDPYQVDSIRDGIEEITDEALRGMFVDKGIKRATDFSWSQVATKVQQVLTGIV